MISPSRLLDLAESYASMYFHHRGRWPGDRELDAEILGHLPRKVAAELRAHASDSYAPALMECLRLELWHARVTERPRSLVELRRWCEGMTTRNHPAQLTRDVPAASKGLGKRWLDERRESKESERRGPLGFVSCYLADHLRIPEDKALFLSRLLRRTAPPTHRRDDSERQRRPDRLLVGAPDFEASEAQAMVDYPFLETYAQLLRQSQPLGAAAKDKLTQDLRALIAAAADRAEFLATPKERRTVQALVATLLDFQGLPAMAAPPSRETSYEVWQSYARRLRALELADLAEPQAVLQERIKELPLDAQINILVDRYELEPENSACRDRLYQLIDESRGGASLRDLHAVQQFFTREAERGDPRWTDLVAAIVGQEPSRDSSARLERFKLIVLARLASLPDQVKLDRDKLRPAFIASLSRLSAHAGAYRAELAAYARFGAPIPEVDLSLTKRLALRYQEVLVATNPVSHRTELLALPHAELAGIALALGDSRRMTAEQRGLIETRYRAALQGWLSPESRAELSTTREVLRKNGCDVPPA